MSTKTARVRVGLIGCGRMGQNHLRVLSLLKNVEIAFVYDANPDVANRMSEVYGIPTGSELELLLPRASAVVICTPTTSHSEMLRLSARYVQNIFIEKPLSHNLESTLEDARFIADNDLNVQVGFIERFNPAVQQLNSVLEQSEQVISIDFTRTNKLSSRITDVDVVADLMIHDIDLALYLNGPVKNLFAQGLVVDGMIALASAQLTHENGRFSRIHASRVTEKKLRQIQATCVDAFVDCELVRKELIIHRQSQIQQSEGGPYVISAIEQTVEVRQQEALLSELQAFVRSCGGERGLGPNEIDALSAAQICEQVQKAILK